VADVVVPRARSRDTIGAPAPGPAENPGAAPSTTGWARRHLGTIVALLLCVAIVAVPVTWVVTSSPSPSRANRPPHVGDAVHRVVSALNATIDSGSYDFTSSEQPVVEATSTSTTCPQVSAGAAPSDAELCGVAQPGLAITAQGTTDTNPFAMVASSNVANLGPITLRDNGTDVWEYGGGDYGLAPGSADAGPGAPLSGFAGSVEGTLGPRQGALAMVGLSSPTGYLTLEQNAITAADQIGTGTVDGVPVTNYRVTLNPAQEADVPGTTTEEATAIHDALGVLQDQGYTGTTVTVSIDGAGFVRQTISVASFADGATQTTEVTLSDFGCAGTVLMPGQSGATSPPAGCTSPDGTDAPPSTG
jgi:hypothetical protein